MKTPDATPASHVTAALFNYCENLLTHEQQVEVEDHLKTCLECSDELAWLENTLDAMVANKEIFCPEPWELYAFAEAEDDGQERVAAHVAQCALCAEEVAGYSQDAGRELMPDLVREAFVDIYGPGKAATESRIWRLISSSRERISSVINSIRGDKENGRGTGLGFRTLEPRMVFDADVSSPDVEDPAVAGASRPDDGPDVVNIQLDGISVVSGAPVFHDLFSGPEGPAHEILGDALHMEADESAAVKSEAPRKVDRPDGGEE
jgi:hypothetical protein